MHTHKTGSATITRDSLPQAGRASSELALVFGQSELAGLRPVKKEFKLHARVEVEVCAWQDVWFLSNTNSLCV